MGPSKAVLRPLRALVRAEIMETLVGVLREPEPGEKARRFFRFLQFRDAVFPLSMTVLPFSFAVLNFLLPQRLEIHLAISAVQNGNSPGNPSPNK